MKTIRMYSRGLLVGTIFLMGNALQPAAYGGGSSGWESNFSSSVPSSHGDPGAPRRGSAAASVLSGGVSAAGGAIHAPGVVNVPAEGIIYYVPFSATEPLPYTATNRDLLVLVLKNQLLG